MTVFHVAGWKVQTPEYKDETAKHLKEVGTQGQYCHHSATGATSPPGGCEIQWQCDPLHLITSADRLCVWRMQPSVRLSRKWQRMAG